VVVVAMHQMAIPVIVAIRRRMWRMAVPFGVARRAGDGWGLLDNPIGRVWARRALGHGSEATLEFPWRSAFLMLPNPPWLPYL